MEEFVPFEIAKKLKEKGFDIPCIYAYCKKGDGICILKNMNLLLIY